MVVLVVICCSGCTCELRDSKWCGVYYLHAVARGVGRILASTKLPLTPAAADAAAAMVTVPAVWDSVSGSFDWRLLASALPLPLSVDADDDVVGEAFDGFAAAAPCAECGER